MKGYFAIIVLVLLSFITNAQKQGNIWYFGHKAGIDFNTGLPFALSDGAMSTFNGCATISNAAGQLLFYTDGITVWDKTHHLMPNGTGLAGGITSTQSAIIVPKPLNPNLYYIFTVDYQMGGAGLEYSVVDITKNGGNGDVVAKNTKIKARVCEKLTAVQHVNHLDYWVIAHDSSTHYLAYLVTDSGVRITPVISGGGVNVRGNTFNAIGYLKLSSGGNKLAGAIKFLNLVETGNFNNATGVVSNLAVLPNINTAYGVEFSPDNTKLYTTDYIDQVLLQYDVSSGNINDIISSRNVIDTSTNVLSAIQLAPDGKIYVSRDAQSEIGVINNPNLAGKACNYKDQGFDLNGRVCYSGLPTFIQSFFVDTTSFSWYNTCYGSETHFGVITSLNLKSWQWDFGDPVSQLYNTDTTSSPVHTFTSAGIYKVQLIVNIGGINDTILRTVTISKAPAINLGPDRVACANEPVTLDAGNPGYSYKWNNGDTTEKITVDSTAKYWVTVSSKDGYCNVSDSVSLTFISSGSVGAIHDTAVCGLKSLTLKPHLKGPDYLWSNGQTDSVITVTKSGLYWVRINFGVCKVLDSINVSFITPPVLKVMHDDMLCEGDVDSLDAGHPGSRYLWSTGDTTQKIALRSGGNYWLRLTDSACIVYDTFTILHCPAKVFMPDIFSPNKDKLNDRFRVYGSDIAKAQIIILDRWGQIVYRGDALDTGWDGSFRGSICPEGLYAYKLIYREYSGTILYDRLLTGRVMLVR